MDLQVQSVDQIVEEITRVHGSLPARPDLDDVEAARSLIRNVEKEEESRLEMIAKRMKTVDVPEELFNIVQEMRKIFLHFTCEENKREALRLLDLENIHYLFDVFVQRASKCVCSPFESQANHNAEKKSTNQSMFEAFKLSMASSTSSSSQESPGFFLESDFTPVRRDRVGGSASMTKDDSYLNKNKPIFVPERIAEKSSSANIPDTSTSGRENNKLNLINLATLIEVSAGKGVLELDLQSRLLEDVEWLPDSLGKLSALVILDLSDNRIQLLPEGIGGLSSLKNLNVYSNVISHLPESVKDLKNLTYLNIRMNKLTSLPDTIGDLVLLEELDAGFNVISSLPNTIGSLISLNKLNLETNNVEEIPHSIGHCVSLRELRVGYNRLRALPEAVGRIASLEVLIVRYNNIKQLPSTMHSLALLRELDVSFNELESVPESLCFATSLLKLNIGNNFACLQYLPMSIGRLELLEELDIRNNQIRFLPESFRMLSNLIVLNAQENPLEIPPRSVIEMGAQPVVQYMEELAAYKDQVPNTSRRSKIRGWPNMCLFLRPSKWHGLR